MKLNSAGFRSVSLCLLLLVALIVVGTGCSGFQATKSFSPLDFLIPGIGMTGSPDEGLTQVEQQNATPHTAPLQPSSS